MKSHKYARPMGWMASAAAVVLAGMTMLPDAMGDQLIYSNGFETNNGYFTNGGTGGTGTISGQGTDGADIKNWTSTLNSGSAQIVTNSLGTNSTEMFPASGDQMLQAQYGTNTLSLNQIIRPANDMIMTDFNFTFKLAVQEDAVSNAGIYIGIRNSQIYSTNANGMDFGLLRYTNNGGEYGFAVRQSTNGGSSFATRVGTNTAPLNEWLTFSLDFDRDTLTFSGTVHDSTNGLVTSFTNVAIWDRYTNMSTNGFDQLGVYVHQVGNKPYFLVDDMSVTVVPEPSTIALALLGGAAVVFYRRRNRASKG